MVANELIKCIDKMPDFTAMYPKNLIAYKNLSNCAKDGTECRMA